MHFSIRKTDPAIYIRHDERELQERKQAVYNNYLKLFQDNPQEAQKMAQEAIMSVTHGRDSKEWTLDDIARLEADVQSKINSAVHEELAESV